MTVSKKDREYVRERARRFCEYCKRSEKIMGMLFEVDHLTPQSKGGTDSVDNLAYACTKCNGHKSDRMSCIDPETGEVSAIFNPRTDQWSSHFDWLEDYTGLSGLTPVGRATIDCLQLNKQMLIEARIEWRKAGWQPPAGD